MPIIEPLKRVNYKGLVVQYLEGKPSMPTIVIAKGLGIPGKEFEWMYVANLLGFNVVYAPYGGTWGSDGQFLAKNEGALSVTNDVSNVVELALREFGGRKDSKTKSNEVFIAADCFGASPALVASTRHPEVTRVFTYGGMIYTDNQELNEKYDQTRDGEGKPIDKSNKLGETLFGHSQQRNGPIFDGYPSLDINVCHMMVRGETLLNPYKHLPELSQKRIFGMAAQNDNLIYYERTVDFINALRQYCLEHGLKPQARLKIISDGGHRSGFGDWEKLQAMQFFTDRGFDMGLVRLMTHLPTIYTTLKKYKRGVRRTEEKKKITGKECFGVPFYDLVVAQIEEFKEAGLMKKDAPLDVILNEIF